MSKLITSLSDAIPIAFNTIVKGINSLKELDFKYNQWFLKTTATFDLVSKVALAQDDYRRLVLESRSTRILFQQSYSYINTTFSIPFIIK